MLKHLHADLDDTGILRASAPEILGPLVDREGGEILCKLLRHLHGDPQDLGLWEVLQGEAWVLSHPEHAHWKSEPADMLQHLRAIEARSAQHGPKQPARVLHIDREIQYTVERSAAGLALEVMVSHSFAWYLSLIHI